MALATLTNIGRAAFAMAVSQRPLHLAWGIGNPTWDEPGFILPSLISATTLTNEIGRRKVENVGFVEPDPQGDIVIPISIGNEGSVQEARYRRVESGNPTPYLYTAVHYNYADAANAVIREMGLFMNTVFADGLPPGQKYFLPVDIVDPGMLIAAQIMVPSINRSPTVRQTVEFVLPI
jgi:hypothetical protein